MRRQNSITTNNRVGIQGLPWGFGFRKGWSPLDISGCALWLDAPREALADDAAVSQWTDRSGNGYHLKQALVARQPIYKTDVKNGLAVLRFDSTDWLFVDDDVELHSNADGMTILAMASASLAANNRGIISKYHDVPPGQEWRLAANFFTCSEGLAGPDMVAPLTAFTGWGLYMGIWTPSDEPEVWKNGVLAGTAPAACNDISDGPELIVVGNSMRNNGSYGWFGDMGEIVAYNKALDNAERVDVTDYLLDRWAV